MRGKLLSDRITMRQGRITPADAGKTVSTGSEGKMYEDHPRGCGEN